MDSILDQEYADAKKQKDHHKFKDRQLKTDIINVMETESGRRLIYKILDDTKMFALTLYHADQSAMCYNIGKRDMGMKIFDLINAAAPELLNKMLKEESNYGRRKASK